MTSLLHLELARARAEEARRHARLRRVGLATRSPIRALLWRGLRSRANGDEPVLAPVEIRIRPGRPDDASALARVAALDESIVPAGPLLVAEIDGELSAACAIATGDVVANPFIRTAHAVELLAVRTEQLRAPTAALRERKGAGRPNLAPADAPSP